MGKKIKCILCGKTLQNTVNTSYPGFVCQHRDCYMYRVYLSGLAAVALDGTRRELKRLQKGKQA